MEKINIAEILTYQMKSGKIFLGIKVSIKPQIWEGLKE